MLRAEREGAVTTLWIDRPNRRNALNAEVIAALPGAIAAAGADEACRCVVLRGAGDHFCAGRELADGEAVGRSLNAVFAYDDAYTRIFEELNRLAKPSVAVVRGYAVAGGFTLAMGCDFVLADETARFGALEMRNGFPAAINSVLLARLAAPRHALELLLSAGTVTARRLEAMGLVNQVAADRDALEALAGSFTRDLAELDPLAVRLTKEAHRAARSLPPGEALATGRNLNALLMASGRIAEGARAFAERQAARRGAS